MPEFSSSDAYTFQIWIQLNIADQRIWIVYHRIDGDGDGGVSVGAENKFGNRGTTLAGLPRVDSELVVSSVPGAPGQTHTITFTAKGVREGNWENCAEMTSSGFFGTALACAEGRVRPRR